MTEQSEYQRILGQRTRALRKERGLTQAVLAERLGVTQEYLGKIERGLGAPSFRMLVDLAQSLGAEPGELLSPAPCSGAAPPAADPDLALREIRHRMRNCFALFANLVDLELQRAESEPVRRVLRDLAARIRCVGVVDGHLSAGGERQPLDLGGKLRQVWEAVSSLYPGPAVVADHRLEPVLVPPDTARTCALVLAEFVTNMYKHAFPDRDIGTFRLRLAQEDGAVRLVLADDGVGLPADPAAAHPGTLGLDLMRSYVEHQLGGTMRLENRGGTTLTVQFPLPAALG
jgi:two-component sensor histidine kinase